MKRGKYLKKKKPIKSNNRKRTMYDHIMALSDNYFKIAMIYIFWKLRKRSENFTRKLECIKKIKTTFTSGFREDRVDVLFSSLPIKCN